MSPFFIELNSKMGRDQAEPNSGSIGLKLGRMKIYKAEILICLMLKRAEIIQPITFDYTKMIKKIYDKLIN